MVKNIEDKDSVIYQADIEEYSDLNLYLDEIDEVWGLDATPRLPERIWLQGWKQWTMASTSYFERIFQDFNKNLFKHEGDWWINTSC